MNMPAAAAAAGAAVDGAVDGGGVRFTNVEKCVRSVFW